MNKAIKLAITKGGYPAIWYEKQQYARFEWQNSEDYLQEHDLVLDPEFWKCLGKALGWAEEQFYQATPSHSHLGETMPEAKWYFRNYMNVIWDYQDRNEFWNKLIGDNFRSLNENPSK